MTAVPKYLILTALLALAGCGKNNESGKSNSGICVQYGNNGQCAQYSPLIGGNGAGFINQIPCMNGGPKQAARTFQVATATIPTAGQTYLGVTSAGDVAVLTGNGQMSQLTVYLCQGSYMNQQLAAVRLGEYQTASCPMKTITYADFGTVVFRDPRFGQGSQYCR